MIEISTTVLVLNIIMVLFVLAGVVYTATKLGKANAGEEWRAEAAAIRQRANRLHDDLDAALEREEELHAHIKKLEDLPDKDTQLQVVENTRFITNLMDEYEANADKRHKELIGFLRASEGGS